jgi:hypothetical protein
VARNIHLPILHKVLDLITDRLNSISQLNKEVPKLEQAKEELEWILNSEENAPVITFEHPSERVLHNLENLTFYLSEYEITPPHPEGPYVVSASGTTTSSDYVVHVSKFVGMYDDREVIGWHDSVLSGYEDLRTSQKRSEKSSLRLCQLDQRLQDLHRESINECLAISAEVKSPIEGAELLRELLVSFKGELIRRCRSGKGTRYDRIADNLAVNSKTTRDIISDEQENYDRIHHELSEIAKKENRRVVLKWAGCSRSLKIM